MQVLTRVRSADVSLRDVTIAHDETGWQGANDVTHWKRAEDFGDFEESQRVETRCRTRRFDFLGSLRRDEFALHGCRTRQGPDEEASIKRLCLSPYLENFHTKVIKRFRTWTKKSLRVFKFRDSNVLSFLYEHYVYMLSTFDIHFTHFTHGCI